MATIDEIAPDVFRICTYVPEFDLQFSQFLVRDDEPLLFHTGMRKAFSGIHEAVATLIDPAKLRWISFSHFESDECGSLNEWLEVAPQAQAACSLVGALVNVDDFTLRPTRPLDDGEVLPTGKKRFRFIRTPHLPHCWEAGMLFEETTATLFCSDLFDQPGQRPVLADAGLVPIHEQGMRASQNGPFSHYLPYTRDTGPLLDRLAGLAPKNLAIMHGSCFQGDAAPLLREEARILREVFGSPVK